MKLDLSPNSYLAGIIENAVFLILNVFVFAAFLSTYVKNGRELSGSGTFLSPSRVDTPRT